MGILRLRNSVKMDTDVLYRMVCETGIQMYNEDGNRVYNSDIVRNKVRSFAQIFNMEHINRILKANKQFHCHAVSDGMSASILYTVPQNILEQLESDELVKKRYDDGFFIYEIGIDPGMRTFNATVRQIDSGKEVSFIRILSQFVNAFHC